MRFWPQALVFELDGMLVEKDSDPARAALGARDLLQSLKEHPWGVVTTTSVEEGRNRLSEAGLPNPPALVSEPDLEAGTAFRRVVDAMGVQARETVAFAATPAAMIGADMCGMEVVRLLRTTASVPTPWWIVDLGQIYSDMRAGHWAVTIAG